MSVGAASSVLSNVLVLFQRYAMSLVDFGKRLLEAAKAGETDEVRTLMSNGAPFTTDWVRNAGPDGIMTTFRKAEVESPTYGTMREHPNPSGMK